MTVGDAMYGLYCLVILGGGLVGAFVGAFVGVFGAAAFITGLGARPLAKPRHCARAARPAKPRVGAIIERSNP